jgi:DNA-binding NarL/FixJ family response regulator
MEASLNTLIRCSRTAINGIKAPSELINGRRHSPNGRAENPCHALTERERQIIRLVCEGLSNKEIGRKCNLSDGTVKVHLHNIYEKLAIHNRTALAVMAAGDLRASGRSDETSDRVRALELAPSTSIPKAAGHLNYKLD